MKGSERQTLLKMTATDADACGGESFVGEFEAAKELAMDMAGVGGVWRKEEGGEKGSADGSDLGRSSAEESNLGRSSAMGSDLGNTLARGDLTFKSALADYLAPFEREASTHHLGIVDAIRAAFTEGYRVGKRSTALK